MFSLLFLTTGSPSRPHTHMTVLSKATLMSWWGRDLTSNTATNARLSYRWLVGNAVQKRQWWLLRNHLSLSATCVFYFNTFLSEVSLAASLLVLHAVLWRERDAQTRFQHSNEASGLFLARLWSREQLWLQEAIHKNAYRVLIRRVKVFSQGPMCVCVCFEPFV